MVMLPQEAYQKGYTLDAFELRTNAMGYILDPLENEEKVLRTIYLKPSEMEKSIIEGSHPRSFQSMFVYLNFVFYIDMDYGIWFSYYIYAYENIYTYMWNMESYGFMSTRE